MITVRGIPNRFAKDNRSEIEVPFNRDNSVEDYLRQAGFDYQDKSIIVSGKVAASLNARVDNGDEIIVTAKMEFDPATWAVIVTVWNIFVVVTTVASIAYAIYSYLSYKSPSTPSFGAAGNDALDSSPTYGWDGIRSTQDPGLPVRILYGEHKVGVNYINAFIRTDGDKSYLNLLGALCEGEIESISDVKLNDNSIDNFRDVTTTVSYDKVALAISSLASSSTTHSWSLGSYVETVQEWPAYYVSQGYISGFVLYGQNDVAISTSYYTFSGNTAQFPTYAKYQAAVTQGGGTGFKGSFVGYGPNVKSVNIYERYGTNNQGIIPNFDDSHNLYDVNVNLNLPADEFTYRTIDSDVEAFEVLLLIPGGLYMTDSGGLYEFYVTVVVYYKKHDAVAWTSNTFTYYGKTRTTLRKSIRIDGLAPDQYDVKVVRNSQATYMSGTVQQQCDLTWTQIDEIKTDGFSYPNTALVGVEAMATDQLSGGLPNLTCVVKGRKVVAPQILNGSTPVAWDTYYYDPVASKYKLLADDTVLTWDGLTYISQYCANPVWCLRDLLLNTRYGLGDFIEVADIDMALFLEQSQYCEERVPDGLGGYEKRFRMDFVVDSQLRALDLIVTACSIFRGLSFYSAGTIKLQIEKPESPVQLFTMGNIISGSFAQNWKSLKQVYNAFELQFLDKDLDYRQDTASYFDEDALNAGDSLRLQKIRYYGSRISQVIREARYMSKVAKYVNRGVTFRAGVDAIACQPGDVVSISHDVPQWGFSGRVAAGSTVSSVNVDQSLTIEDGKTYKLRVQFSDDTVEEQTVNNVAGTFTAITVSTPFTQAPASFDKFAFGESTMVKKDFRIVNMKLNSDNEVDISAYEYSALLYDDSTYVIPDTKYSALVIGTPNVIDLVLTERVAKLGDGTIENCIDVSFDLPVSTNYVSPLDKVRIYISENQTDWRYKGEVTTRHFEIVGDIASNFTYYVKAVSVSVEGVENPKATSPGGTITVLGKAAYPEDVTSFLVNQNRDRLSMGWTEVSDVDIWGYDIRYGASWTSGEVIAFVQGNKYATTYLRTGTDQKYFIKALDTSGNYSETAKQAVITIDNIPFRNVIVSYSEQAAWAGTHSNTTEDGVNLIISPTFLTGTYVTPVRNVGYVATFYIGIEVITSIASGRTFNADAVTKFDSSPTARFSGEDAPSMASFEIRTSEDGDDPTDPADNWTAWSAWQSGDYKCRWFQLRMTLTRDVVSDNLICSQLNYYADLPDVDELQDGEVTDAVTGDVITFAKTFHEDPALNVTILTGTGVYWKATSLDTSGVTIWLYQADGTSVLGTFRLHIHGV